MTCPTCDGAGEFAVPPRRPCGDCRFGGIGCQCSESGECPTCSGLGDLDLGTTLEGDEILLTQAEERNLAAGYPVTLDDGRSLASWRPSY